MQTRTTLDHISNTGCSVKTEKYIEDNGIQYVIGQPMRVSYINDIDGRERLEQDYPDYYNALVMTVWGDSPTVKEQSRQAE